VSKQERATRRAVDEWETAQVLAYLEEQGRPLSRATWYSYVSRGQAPKPVRYVGRTPLFDADAVREWHAGQRRKAG
jgi:predicted DNA-binding transcriptional regulator AlpA